MKQSMVQVQGRLSFKSTKSKEEIVLKQFQVEFEDLVINLCEKFNVNSNFHVQIVSSKGEYRAEEVYAHVF